MPLNARSCDRVTGSARSVEREVLAQRGRAGKDLPDDRIAVLCGLHASWRVTSMVTLLADARYVCDMCLGAVILDEGGRAVVVRL